MAGGAFISGATSELSCDAPLREPYEVYLQGGLDVSHGMLAAMSAAAGVIA
jgi:cystathionine beta-lyase family protein involved in aluminum resistance